MLILHTENLVAPGVRHGFFGRSGGVSTGIYESLNCGPGSGDARAAIIENRERVRVTLGADTLATSGQVHGTTALTVIGPWRLGDTAEDDKRHVPLGDALVTARPGIALGILTADCAPVLLSDSQARVIGAAHAGWRGALGGIVESALAAMEKLGAKRDRIVAAIGPCIAQANYEVGAAFRAQFVAADSANATFFAAGDRGDHARFDLEGYVAQRLQAAGVASVEALHTDTYARADDFFSFRRNTHRRESRYGRQISAIALTP